MLQWAGLFYFLWCFVIQAVFEFINCTVVTNRDLTSYQLFYNELEPVTAPYKPNLKAYKVIGSHYEVLILLEKQPKAYKVKARTESGRFLAVLGSKNCLVYIPTKNIMTKTPFFKLYELKNPLFLEGVLKLIEIRPLNDVSVTLDSIGERVSLDLLEIDDDIGFLKLINPEVSRSSRPLEPVASRPFKLLKPVVPRFPRLPEPENRPLELMFRPFEKPIKPVNSLDPDEMQLDLVISLCYRVKTKIFKKKLDKNSFISNMYKQALKSPNVKKWLAVTFSEFKQLISLETLKFLFYEVM